MLPCKSLFTGVSVSVCVFTLVSISIERYFAICQPLRSRSWQTLRHSYKAISLIWLVSLLIMIPEAVHQKHIPLMTGGHKCLAMWSHRTLEIVYTFFIDVALLVVPLIVMFIAYGLITIKLFRGFSMNDSGRHRHNSCPVALGGGPLAGKIYSKKNPIFTEKVCQLNLGYISPLCSLYYFKLNQVHHNKNKSFFKTLFLLMSRRCHEIKSPPLKSHRGEEIFILPRRKYFLPLVLFPAAPPHEIHSPPEIKSPPRC